jgi:hypothetical protein
MRDYRDLRVGDRVVIVEIPKSDLDQYKLESSLGLNDAPSIETVAVLQRLISLKKVCKITHVDEYGFPWFDYSFGNSIKVLQCGSLNISENQSWRFLHEADAHN